MRNPGGNPLSASHPDLKSIYDESVAQGSHALLELDQIGEGSLIKRSSQRSTRKVVLEEKIPPNDQFQGQCRLIPFSGTSTESQISCQMVRHNHAPPTSQEKIDD